MDSFAIYLEHELQSPAQPVESSSPFQLTDLC